MPEATIPGAGVWWLIPACALLSALATWLYLHWAQAQAVLDHPGPRSSHEQPCPTGGGLGIVLAVIAGFLVLESRQLTHGLAFSVGLPAIALALLGMVDDRIGLPVIVRLLAQLVATATLLLLLRLGDDFGMTAIVLAALAMLWLTNLFNFMDGIDGIAASQALTVAVGAGLLLTPGSVHASMLWVIAAACAGFLCFNWPPARLFMGDTGSLFLGFMLGGMALDSIQSQTLGAWTWLILWAGFVSDTSVTLLLRGRRGELVYQAHRDHAYQRLARYWQGHRPVTVAYMACNVLWLWPLAWLAEDRPGLAITACLLAYLPLLLGVWWLDQAIQSGKMTK